MTTDTRPTSTAPPSSRSLVSLLGTSRAAIVDHLHGVDDASVAELAGLLDISEVATRRHLLRLEEEGLVDARTVNTGRGRPAARYQLTGDARRLFPSGYDQLAGEVLDFLGQTQGREGVRDFLRWRLERQVTGLADTVTADDLELRLSQLAEALSAAGFDASVASDGHGFTLTQDHCAIEDVARDHPEVCAYEAATFAAVLGSDVHLRRRTTVTRGSTACVCCITPRDGAPDGIFAPRARDDATTTDGDAVAVVPNDLTTTGSALPVLAPTDHHREDAP